MCFISVSSVRINGMINNNDGAMMKRGREEERIISLSNCVRVMGKVYGRDDAIIFKQMGTSLDFCIKIGLSDRE